MSLSDLAAIGSFVSGLAVLISLVYLAQQMRQNTAQMQNAEMNAAQTRFSQFRFAIANSRDVAHLWAIGAADGPLDDVDELRFSNLLVDLSWSIYHTWERDGRGKMSGDIPSAVPYLATLLTSKRGGALWQTLRLAFPTSFDKAVDEAIKTATTTTTAAK